MWPEKLVAECPYSSDTPTPTLPTSHLHIDMHKHTQTYTHAPQTLADTLIHKHTCITYVYTQTHMHTQMHRHAGVHTHAGIHTHMHTQSCTQIVSPLTPRNNEPYFFTILDWSDAK